MAVTRDVMLIAVNSWPQNCHFVCYGKNHQAENRRDRQRINTGHYQAGVH